MNKKCIVIGSGFGGLGSAILMAKEGYDVTIYEKNEIIGGRANLLQKDGFKRDMGPSRYLMPDVFEKFFQEIGENVSDYLDLVKLDPSYRVFFKDVPALPKTQEINNNLIVDISPDLEKNIQTFESIETGAGKQLENYLQSSEEQYQIAMDKFVYKNYTSWWQFLSLDILLKTRKLRIRKTMHQYVSRFFRSPELQKIMEYTMLFLGTSPYQAPALFNIMSHVDFGLGVYYPQGGIHEIPKALVKIAKKYGVRFETGKEVEEIIIENGKVTGIKCKDGSQEQADIIISNADMRHSETKLLKPEYQSYPDSYREKKVMAPSAFILYLGVKGKLPNLTHHNLIFAKDWNKGYKQIFDNPQLPDDPSLYICKPSEVDPSVAPEGHENLFVLVPVAPGLVISEQEQETYYHQIIQDISKICSIPDLPERIVSKHIFSVQEFSSKYNAYKGTALGLAHPLFQSAIRRPDNKSKKVAGLYYAGGYTNPGIGMPMCLISAMLVRDRIKSL